LTSHLCGAGIWSVIAKDYEKLDQIRLKVWTVWGKMCKKA